MFTQAELTLLRQSLDVITITGKDAAYVAKLQKKVEDFLTPPSSEKQMPKGK